MKCTKEDNNVTTLQFYSYKLNVRDDFSQFLNMGRLTQQLVVDFWVKIESSRLYFLKKEQHVLRTELYRGLMDYLNNKTSLTQNVQIGKMFILPSSFTGSPRALQQNYTDAMC